MQAMEITFSTVMFDIQGLQSNKFPTVMFDIQGLQSNIFVYSTGFRYLKVY